MPSNFLINFHQKYFAGTEVPIYSKQVFYKLLEEIKKNSTGEKNDKRRKIEENRS